MEAEKIFTKIRRKIGIATVLAALLGGGYNYLTPEIMEQVANNPRNLQYKV